MSIKVRKHYTAEFKAQAVELVRAGRATQTVAAELVNHKKTVNICLNR